MNAAAMRAMYSRRASVIGWEHARPISAAKVNDFTQGPRLSLGETWPNRNAEGAFGETYMDEVRVRAYTTGKISAVLLQLAGFVEAGDMELCVLAPFTIEPAAGIVALPPELETAYNDGDFMKVVESPTLAAADRFRFLGRKWIVKALPTPIIDGDTVHGWRILVTKLTL